MDPTRSQARNSSHDGDRGVRLTRVLPSLLLLCLIAPSSYALDPSMRLTQYVHDSWTSNDGLPQDSINGIAQTPDGYLWLATQEGIARFDGIHFTIFDSRTTNGAIKNFVYTLFVDRAGTLWAGASGGLLRYDNKGDFVLIGTAQGWPDSSAKFLSQDSSGNLWAGLATGSESEGSGKGLVRFNAGAVKIFTTNDGLSSDQVCQTWLDGDDLWIATGRGLDRMSGGVIKHLVTRSVLDGARARAVVKDRDGSLWIGTPHGLLRWSDGHLTSFTTADGLLDDKIESIYEDHDGVLWIGTGKGVNRFLRGAIEPAAGIPGIGDDEVFCFLEDREGSLWIGTHNSGLHRLRAGKFTPLGPAEGLVGSSVTAMEEDRAGRMWIATSTGDLNAIEDGKVLATYGAAEGLDSDDIRALLEDSTGRFWVGAGTGLQTFYDGRFTPPVSSGLAGEHIKVLAEDHAHVLWIGTTHGLGRMRNGRIEPFALPPEAPSSIRLLHEERNGRLWIGGGDGLGYLANGRYIALPQFRSMNVQSVHDDGDGTLWFTTWGSGLIRVKNGTTTRYTSADGLFDDVAWQIADDGRGNFWMESNRGVFRVTRQELNAFAAGSIGKITSISYDAMDGLRRRETNLTQHAIIRAHDGKLWFATIAGAAFIDPANIRTNRLPPPVILEHFTADGRAVPLAEPLVIRPGRGSLEIGYVALSFITPSRVHYRYKLEGFDQTWIDAGTRRTAYYTNIGPGTYTFKVIAASDDGVWNETGASIRFELSPSFYQTWWFYALLVIALVLLAAAIRALRKRQLAIRHQVYHDPLTGLANRTLLAARAEVALTQAVRLKHSIAILFLDLDGFKSVNDTSGHAVGDRLLQLVAARFQSCIRDIDTLARIGGDEFAVLVADLADEARAAEVAQRMLDAIGRDFGFDGHHITLGVSIGIAVHPFDGSEIETMLQAADRAMYRAKLAGGNSYQFNAADPSEPTAI
jgi:diguanylate cyclase (GGDEF)-like protein